MTVYQPDRKSGDGHLQQTQLHGDPREVPLCSIRDTLHPLLYIIVEKDSHEQQGSDNKQFSKLCKTYLKTKRTVLHKAPDLKPSGSLSDTWKLRKTGVLRHDKKPWCQLKFYTNVWSQCRITVCCHWAQVGPNNEEVINPKSMYFLQLQLFTEYISRISLVPSPRSVHPGSRFNQWLENKWICHLALLMLILALIAVI